MKRLFALMLILLPIHLYGQEIGFDSYSYNFGAINEVDGVVEHTFRYTNKSKSPFVILSVVTSCGCTNPTYSTDPLAVGASANFVIRFDPADRPGRFDKNIQISSNQGLINLSISGIVNPRPRTIKDDYPFIIGSQLRASELLPRVEPAPRGRLTSKIVKVVNDSYIPLTIAIDSTALPKWLTVRIDKPFIDPAQKANITLRINGGDMWGMQSVSIPVIVNGTRQAEKIHLTATFTRDFSTLSSAQRQAAAKAELSSYFYHFSTQKVGASPSTTIKIRNSGKSTLYIDHIDTSSKCVSYNLPSNAIAPGATVTMQVKLHIDSAEYISESIKIICSDPFSPIREIRLAAGGF